MTQTAQVRRPFPEVGEIFELTAGEEITGFKMIENWGHSPEGWASVGATVPDGMTKRFKLVADGYQHNFDDVARALKDDIGCWLEIFRETFDTSGEHPPVGVLDISWGSPSDPRFPVVLPFGFPFFFSSLECRFYDNWLLLREVKDNT